MKLSTTPAVRFTAIPAALALGAIHLVSGPVSCPAAEIMSAPVGEYQVPVPAGTSAWVYGLVAAERWTGVAGGVTAGVAPESTQIEVPGALFGPGELTSHPHYLEIVEGPLEGLVMDITGSTPVGAAVPGVTVAGAYAGDIEPGTPMVIRPHATIRTMFDPVSSGIEAYADLIIVPSPFGQDRLFMSDGEDWRDAMDWTVADDDVVYPGQGFFLSLNGQNTGDLRHLVFGRGPVNRVKRTKTLIPLYASFDGLQMVGPVWPVELLSSGAARTVAITGVGLENALVPFNDLAVTFSNDGYLQDTGVYLYDGVGLYDAVQMTTGPALESHRFVKGGALYIQALEPHYWPAAGVK